MSAPITSQHTRHRTLIVAGGLIIFLGLALWIPLATQKGKFERELRAVQLHPEKHIGRQADIATDPTWVSSHYLTETVDQAYSDLSRSFSVPGRTYFSNGGDMPTQEIIWQFPDYFVRLYATSALECDGAAIGSFSGTYDDFRGKQLAPDVDPAIQFSLIDYKSPKRFLNPSR